MVLWQLLQETLFPDSVLTASAGKLVPDCVLVASAGTTVPDGVLAASSGNAGSQRSFSSFFWKH
jgi:hypothetical protein